MRHYFDKQITKGTPKIWYLPFLLSSAISVMPTLQPLYTHNRHNGFNKCYTYA